MPSLRRIAAAQTAPAPGEVETNLAEHLRLARVAADEGAGVVIFPELSLTGYELHLSEALAFTEDDARLEPLVEEARARSLILVVGAPVRLGRDLHIGAFIVKPDGAIDLHTKQRLGAFSPDVNPGGPIPPAEDTVFAPGTRCPLVQLSGHTAALGICAESLRRSHPAAAADRGATTYLTSHFGIPLDVGLRADVLRGHAERHAMAVAFANYGGPTGGLAAGGKSAIWSERGELVAALGEAGSGVIIAHEAESGWQGKAIAMSGS